MLTSYDVGAKHFKSVTSFLLRQSGILLSSLIKSNSPVEFPVEPPKED